MNEMNDMNALLEGQLPGLGNVFLTLFIGLLIGLIYGVLKRIINAAFGQGQSGRRWRTRLDLIERIFWPALVVAILMSLLSSRPLVGIALTVLLMAVFFNPMRNFVLGLVYKSGKTYALGQRINYLNHSGSIRTFNILSLELEMEDGSMLDIPYSNFARADILRSSPKTGVLSHAFEIAIAKPCDILLIKQKIRAQLLAMPYVLPDQKIVFEHSAETDQEYVVKVIVHGVDKGQMYQVEGRIKAIYGGGLSNRVN